MNKHIETYLDHYLSIDNPDYAVMLNGEWGCGKTYFIKKYIEAKQDKKICYISLNGIKQCNDVIPQILLALAPKEFNSKICKGVISIGRTIAYGITKFFNVDNVFNIGDLANCIPENIVFVFDDLERTLLKPQEILGFLSDLVEQQNFHVIIIGDETKFKENIKDEYLSRKEKIIGKTFNLQNNDKLILPALIKDFNYTGFQDLLEKNLETIIFKFQQINQFCQRKQINYRIVKAAIREFHFAFAKIFEDQKIKEYKTKTFEDLFFRYIVMFYCLQVNYITLDELKSFHNYLLPNENEEEKLNEFKNKFSDCVYNTFLDKDMWSNILEYREIDHNQIIKFIIEKNNPVQPDWVKLWCFMNLEDQELDDIYQKVLNNIKEKKYLKIHEIIHVFMIQVKMAQVKLISKTPDDILKDAKKYMDIIGDDLEWDDIQGEINYRWESSNGYGYYAEDTKEFQEITSYLDKKIKEKCKINRTKKYLQFIDAITEDEKSYLKIIDENYLRADIFADNAPKILWDKVINLNPKAFRDICYSITETVASRSLYPFNGESYSKPFWIEIIELSKKFLDENLPKKTNRVKCVYLREQFIPALTKMVNKNEQQ